MVGPIFFLLLFHFYIRSIWQYSYGRLFFAKDRFNVRLAVLIHQLLNENTTHPNAFSKWHKQVFFFNYISSCINNINGKMRAKHWTTHRITKGEKTLDDGEIACKCVWLSGALASDWRWLFRCESSESRISPHPKTGFTLIWSVRNLYGLAICLQ